MAPRDEAQARRAAQRALLRPTTTGVTGTSETTISGDATSQTPTTGNALIDVAIESVCHRCFGHALSKAEVTNLRPLAISQNGRAHKAANGKTDCGQPIKPTWTRIT